MKDVALSSCLVLTLALTARAQENSPSDAAVKFFETNVRPVLAKRCFECHGETKQKGKLRVDSLAALLAGGRSGTALQAGRPDDSLLIQAIRHGESLQMPPKTKLPAKEIADLTAWVTMGAPWPGAKAVVAKAAATEGEPVFTKKQLDHWAFQPIRKPTPPSVKDRTWIHAPIDAFILAKLEEKGIPPAPPADPRTLLRRVYFDLIGLPPTAEQVEAFVADVQKTDRHVAFENVVERLLASPRYGERWARHWLDLARYADSNGMDENIAFGNAWRYRDYVVEAFNSDKPYDRFLREQIAGDLLKDGTSNEGLIATGFLVIGPKMLAEDDPVKMEMDIIDEQIDTIGRAFMGMTLGCVRCHDHKYDPLSMSDYYGLAGIFKSTKTMDNFKVVARWHERPLGATVEQSKGRAAQIASLKNEIDQIVKRSYREMIEPERKRADAYLQAALALKRQPSPVLSSTYAKAKDANQPGLIVLEAEDFTRGNAEKSRDNYGAKIGVILTKGDAPKFVEYDVHVKDAGSYQLELRYAAAESRPVQVSLNGHVVAHAAGKTTGTWFPDSQTWFAECVLSLKAGVNVIRLHRADSYPHIDKLALIPTKQAAVKSLEQWSHESNLRPELLRQWVAFLETKEPPKDAIDLETTSIDVKGPFGLTPAIEAGFAPAVQKELSAKRAQLTKLEKSAPATAEAMAVDEGKIANLRIHLRGNHVTLGKEAPRRFPTAFTGLKHTPINATDSGRLQLAEWISQPEHPLTSRVMVNRLWHWRFGSGLVRSVDNFGLLGDAPSHPELLDWLASEFIASGWSIKAMHRAIVLSNTYQMSSEYREAAYQLDPDNRLHWRHARRRLEAEALRDSLYALGGKLDFTVGGSLFIAPNRKYVSERGNFDKYEVPRRSIYLPIVRSATYEFLTAFDFADPSFPSGERATTTVAPQALFLMNGKVVHEQTRLWATSLLADDTLDDAGRIRRIYVQAFGRPASESETTRAADFVQRLETELSRAQAWQVLCRAIVSANEFVYVE